MRVISWQRAGLALLLTLGLAGCGSLETADFYPSVSDCQAMGFSCRSVGDVYRDAGNVRMAERFYLLGAQSGNADAKYSLASEYGNHGKLPTNHERAAFWYTRAAEQGHRYAQNNLGVMYERGDHVEQNLYVAQHLYQLSAAQGNETAQRNLPRLEKRINGWDPKALGAMRKQYEQLRNAGRLLPGARAASASVTSEPTSIFTNMAPEAR